MLYDSEDIAEGTRNDMAIVGLLPQMPSMSTYKLKGSETSGLGVGLPLVGIATY
jgi:hypothetical protein